MDWEKKWKEKEKMSNSTATTMEQQHWRDCG